MTRKQVRREIEELRYNYGRLQENAMNNGDELLAAQNAGAYLALDLLLSNLGLDDKWNEELETEYEDVT